MVDIKTCKQCKHIWAIRTEKIPQVCPKCKSYKWNEVKKVKK